MIKVDKPFELQDIVEKLRIRAHLRRRIRGSDRDNIADLCESAADEIEDLRDSLSNYRDDLSMCEDNE